MAADFTLDGIHDVEFGDRIEALFEADVRRLMSRRDEFVASDCPACGAVERHLAFEHRGFEFQRCEACRTVYISPCPTDAHIRWFLGFSDAMRVWRDEMPSEMVESRRAIYAERADYVTRMLSERGIGDASVLDIGAGRGELAEALHGRAGIAEIILVEPQPLELAVPGARVIAAGFEDVSLDEAVNVVVAFEVFEHLLDPDRFLGKVRGLLAPGGILIMSTPNVEGFEIRALGPLSTSVPFDHVRLYNPASLALVLERNGFEVLHLETPGRLDVEMVRLLYVRGEIAFPDDPEMRSLMEGDESRRRAFQRDLVENKRSSHMRCAAAMV